MIGIAKANEAREKIATGASSLSQALLKVDVAIWSVACAFASTSFESCTSDMCHL
jgi:hypothetical protein